MNPTTLGDPGVTEGFPERDGTSAMRICRSDAVTTSAACCEGFVDDGGLVWAGWRPGPPWVFPLRLDLAFGLDDEQSTGFLPVSLGSLSLPSGFPSLRTADWMRCWDSTTAWDAARSRALTSS